MRKEFRGLDRTAGISLLGDFGLVVEELSSQVLVRQSGGAAAGSSTDASRPSEMFSERRVCVAQFFFFASAAHFEKGPFCPSSRGTSRNRAAPLLLNALNSPTPRQLLTLVLVARGEAPLADGVVGGESLLRDGVVGGDGHGQDAGVGDDTARGRLATVAADVRPH